uniref:NADH-ubiquinone oxidoreductase chain 5 n=1 Tax=Aposthonia borneensis TaxID=1208762 RepID=A0A678QUR3_9NEOP|nr:NADH dehydrogenase subunit 5 [Aposthonia borneensis]
MDIYIMMISFFLGVLGVYMIIWGIFMLGSGSLFLYEWEFKNVLYLEMEFVLWFDWMSFMFMGLVMLISSVILLYSVWYMSGDFSIKRFIYMLLMFVFSMIMLIVSPNLVSVLLGWDGLGLVSYCLIIYYNNWSSYVSGMITVMFNRLGDVGILLSIGYLFSFGDWNVASFWGKDFVGEGVLLGSFIILGGMTSSAQIPFCSWLPIAMAAPTPVSSLVHSSTLVTAGVYLLIRYSDLTSYDELMGLGLLGGLTMMLSGLVANYEYDLSKIIALSTLSQLGFMFLLVSLNMIDMVFFHLLMHALFKALLFMFSGILIHMMSGLQDIRFMGGLFNNVPEILLLVFISGFSLMGIPFFMGFYSKDLAIEFCTMESLNFYVWFMLMVSLSLTIMYTVRLYLYMILNLSNYNGGVYSSLSDGLSNFLIISSWILVSFVLVSGGYLLSVIFPYLNLVILSSLLSYIIMNFMLLGVIGGVMVFKSSGMEMNMGYIGGSIYFIYIFFGSLIYMPSLSLWGSLSFMNIGYLSTKVCDKGWLEFNGGQGLVMMLMIFGSKIQWFQDGKLIEYFSLLMLLLFIVFWMVV